MKWIEELFMLPFKILMKLLWISIPFVIGIVALLLVVQYPYQVLCFLCGFCISPWALSKCGITLFSSKNIFDILEQEYQKLNMHRSMLKNIKKGEYEKGMKEKQKLQKEIQDIKEEIDRIPFIYLELLYKKPDKIIYIKPQSFLRQIKNTMKNLGIYRG